MLPIQKVREIVIRHDNLEKELSSGSIEPKLFAKKSKEYSDLKDIILVAREYLNFESQKKDLESIMKDKSNDNEMIAMAEIDLKEINLKKKKMKIN